MKYSQQHNRLLNKYNLNYRFNTNSSKESSSCISRISNITSASIIR